MEFRKKLSNIVRKNSSILVVGLDPDPLKMPVSNIFEFNKTIIDKNSLDIIYGSIIDYKQEMVGSSFVINNPKASSSCGCGLSFSV